MPKWLVTVVWCILSNGFLTLTGRLHLILASKYDLIPIDFETVLARKMFYIDSRKSKNFHTEQYQGIKMFQFSYIVWNFASCYQTKLQSFSSDAVKVITKPVGWCSYIKLGSRHTWFGIHTTAQTKICTSAKGITYHYHIMVTITMTFPQDIGHFLYI